MTAKVVFLDTETTGLDSELHEVWEIGYIVRDPKSMFEGIDLYRLHRVYPDLSKASPDGIRIGQFYERTSDMRSPRTDHHAIGSGTYNLVDGFTGKPIDPPLGGYLWSDPAALAAELAHELVGAHIVGAVPWFDAALNGSFLSRFLKQHGQLLACHYHLVDVEAMAVGYLHGRASKGDVDAADRAPATGNGWDSNDLSAAVGVDPDQFDRHTALGDAMWARAIHDKITSA